MRTIVTPALENLYAFICTFLPPLSRLVLSQKQRVEILDIATRYNGEHFGTAWMLLRVEEKDPWGSFYYVITTREGERRWRIVWKGCLPDMRHKIALRHVRAECLNEVYLDVGPLTFYIGY